VVALPRLGVGVVYAPGLEPLLEAGADVVDVLELEPQTFWFTDGPDGYRIDPRVLPRFADWPGAVLIHGVGFPVGGSVGVDAAAVAPFVAMIEALGAPWCSEHLSFNRAPEPGGPRNAGFLMPPLQTAAGVDVAVRNITELTARLPVPFAFETGVNYLQPLPGELPDGEFFATVAERADCGLLVDLHNLWANERNGRQPVADVLAALPPERIWELHVAGGQEFQGYWLDAHSGYVPGPVMELAADLIARLPNLGAVNFELMPDYIAANGLSLDRIIGQLAELRAAFERRVEVPR
jgi:uncharacterized protein